MIFKKVLELNRPLDLLASFGLDIFLNFAHGMDRGKKSLSALKQESIKGDRHYERGL